MRKLRKLFFGGLLFWLAAVTTANGQVVKYLNNEWLVYDHETKQLFPFVKKNKKTLPLHLLLQTEDYQGMYLSVSTSVPLALYVDNKFFKEFSAEKTSFVAIDSLKHGTEPSLLSFYGDYSSSLIDSIAIIYKPGPFSMSGPNAAGTLMQKVFNFSKSYFALVLLGAFAFFVFLKVNYSKAYQLFFNLKDLITNFRLESLQGKSTIEGYYFAFIVLGSIFFALSICGLPISDMAGRAPAFSGFIGTMFKLVFVSLFFYFLKFVFIYVVSWLFSIGKFALTHFKVFVSVSLLWSVSLLLVTMLSLSELSRVYHLDTQLVLIISLFFLTLTSLKVSVIINRATTVSTLYLISYLCITEWLPYLVILKLYMVYFY